LQKGRFASAAIEAGGEDGSHEGVQRSAASIAAAIESFGCRPVRQHDTVETLRDASRHKIMTASRDIRALRFAFFRCSVPEPRELRRFVSRPPPGGNRLHCTMLRHAVEPVPCYTLYLEYLGGLVPLLKGRRISKIRPEFVIFDPQSQETLHVLDDSSQCPSYSDGSDTEKDTADLCGSPRYRKKNRKRKEDKSGEEATIERDDKQNDLAYVDTLPEVMHRSRLSNGIRDARVSRSSI